jgi:hypothetical protein
MIVFIGFLTVIFLATAQRELRGRPLRTRWIMLLSVLTTISFLSLRIID